MNPEGQQKQLDPSITHIGTELECLIVHEQSLKEVSPTESQQVFRSLIDKYGWKKLPLAEVDPEEIHQVSKIINGKPITIKLDVSYAIFEATTPPVESLDELELLHKQIFKELNEILKKKNLIIWPHGVAPASSGLHNLSHTVSHEIVNDTIYTPLCRLESEECFNHIASHQVSIDVPLTKIIPAVNAFYKNLGNFINKFANSPLRIGETVYKEGRYHFWIDFDPPQDKSKHHHGAVPIFPDTPFLDLNDFLLRIWQGAFAFVVRDNTLFTFKDLTTRSIDFINNRKGTVVSPDGSPLEVDLTTDDIRLLPHLNWLDFKPHFDLDDTFTVDEFVSHVQNQDLNTFFQNHCTQSYLEIRCCSPHLENNAMDIPRYFYDIIQNLDAFISQSESISWEEAKEKRDQAILR